MTKDEMKTALKSNIVNVEFVKADGSIRKMKATLMPALIPESKSNTTPRKEPDEVIRVVDTEIGEWRSFRVDSVTKFGDESLVLEVEV